MRAVAVAMLGAVVISFLARSPEALASDVDGGNDAELRSYFSGNGLLNRGLYDLAATEYRKFLENHDDHEKAPVARYGLAVCLFRTQQHVAAATELARLTSISGFAYAPEVGTMSGQCALAMKRYDAAAEAFERVVRDHARHDLADDAAVGWIEALYLAKDYKKTVKQAERFARRHSDSPLFDRVALFRGLAEMGRSEYAAAAGVFDGLIERDRRGPFADQSMLLLAQCYHHENDLDKATRAYRKVLKRAESGYVADALHGLASLLQARGRSEESGELLDRLLAEFPDSPLNASSKLLRARAYFDLGQYDRAFELFAKAAKADANAADEVAYWMAKCRLREGDFRGALQRLDAAIEKYGESDLIAEMHYDRAVALLRLGQDANAGQALADFRSRYAEHAMAPHALHLLAMTEHKQRAFDASLAHCDEFEKKYTTHERASAIAFLAPENEFLSGDYANAAKAYTRFLDRFGDDRQAGRGGFRLGMCHYHLDRFDDAQPWLERAADSDERTGAFKRGLLALGDIHFRRGEWKRAEAYLKDYLDTVTGVALADEALLQLALCRLRRSLYEDALAALDELVDRFPDSPHRLQAVFERGQALVALDRVTDAEAAFRRVLSEGQDSRFAPYATNHLASIALQTGDFKTAIERFDSIADADLGSKMKTDALFQQGQATMAAKDFSAAERIFARFVDTDSGHARAAEAHAYLAISLARQDRHDDALAAIKRVDRKARRSLTTSLRSSLAYEKAWCLRSLSRVGEAADAYRELLAHEPAPTLRAHAMLDLAGIEADVERFDEAAKLLRALRELVGEHSAEVAADVVEQGSYRLAVCAFELGRYKRAAELFEEFLGAFSESSLVASANYFCGEAWLRLDRHERGVKFLARVVEAFPSDPAYGPALLRLGESLALLQRWAKSEQACALYLSRFPNGEHAFKARFGVGWARENQHRHGEAITAYRKVVNQHKGPTAARAQFQIGECLFALEKHDEAVAELLKVDILYAYPQWSAAALFEAGRCFEKLSKPDQARDQFKRVADQYGSTHWAKLARQQLSKMAAGPVPGR